MNVRKSSLLLAAITPLVFALTLGGLMFPATASAAMPASTLSTYCTRSNLADLARKSIHPVKNMQGAICEWFVFGVVDGFAQGVRFGQTETSQALGRAATPQQLMATRAYHSGICVRPTVTGLQLAQVVADYLSSNPGVMDEEASSVVLVAVRSAFHC